jgi:head-tail adaptor
MGLGRMNKKAQLCRVQNTIDSEGFSRQTVEVLADIRVFVEAKHGSERWANLAAFSEATTLFRFRKIPSITVTTKHYILFNDEQYNILSVEDVMGRNMYIEVLAKKMEASNG